MQENFAKSDPPGTDGGGALRLGPTVTAPGPAQGRGMGSLGSVCLSAHGPGLTGISFLGLQKSML